MCSELGKGATSDLVIIAPTMEQLGRWVADWKHTEVTDQLHHPESSRLR